jgi:hypothetical protein
MLLPIATIDRTSETTPMATAITQQAIDPPSRHMLLAGYGRLRSIGPIDTPTIKQAKQRDGWHSKQAQGRVPKLHEKVAPVSQEALDTTTAVPREEHCDKTRQAHEQLETERPQ